MSEYQVTSVVGFDRDGEPEIRLYPDGKIELVFNFMPPSNGNPDGYEDPIFDKFEDTIQHSLGVHVDREDREFFVVNNPTKDTVTDLKKYLENFWNEYNKDSKNNQ